MVRRKRFFSSSFNVYFTSAKKAGYIPAKENVTPYGNVYGFREIPWHKGLAVDVDAANGQITSHSDKTYSIISLTKNSYDWKQRKIIYDIHISCDKNVVEEFDDCIQYGIIRVKKSIFDTTTTGRLRDNTYVCSDELQTHTDFKNSPVQIPITLKGLNIDLSADDDLVFYQQVQFVGDNHLLTSGGRKLGYATKPYSTYNIVLTYTTDGI
jgi:hypothetical protein